MNLVEEERNLRKALETLISYSYDPTQAVARVIWADWKYYGHDPQVRVQSLQSERTKRYEFVLQYQLSNEQNGYSFDGYLSQEGQEILIFPSLFLLGRTLKERSYSQAHKSCASTSGVLLGSGVLP